jgi:hypothetical protein
MPTDRFARQRLLAEVGDHGQRRFAEASVCLADGPEAEVAADYLRRAGFGAVSVSSSASPTERAFPHGALFRHAASAALAAGAWCALDRIRELTVDADHSHLTDRT